MKISGEALELAFRIVLSCPCDVTHEQELRVFDRLRRLAHDEVADYAPVLDAFDSDATPFHGLAAFTRWMADDEAAVIGRHRVLRCNASSHRWQNAVATLPAQSRRVSSISTFLLSHMVVPVSLTAEPGRAPCAEYRYEGGAAELRNVFLPPEFDPASAELWAAHLGAIVGPLNDSESELVSALNEANAQLLLHRRRVTHVDYSDFELQGDYREFCRCRHAPFWGVASGAAAR